jgi:hypothetical protein
VKRAAIALVLAVLPGCVAPTIIASAGANALQAGTAAFINGELDAAQIAPLEDALAAAVGTLQDLKFGAIHTRRGEHSVTVYAQETNGREVRIILVPRSPLVTKINIRVGLMGDQAISRLLLAEVQARCPAVPEPSALPTVP